MAKPNATNSSKTYLYVDTSFLHQLYAAGGSAAWDTMLNSGGGEAAKAVGDGAQAVEGSPALAAMAAGMQGRAGG